MHDPADLILGWIHLLSIIIWIGGAIFYDRILQTSLKTIAPDQAGKLVQDIMKRFIPLVWVSLIAVAATGLLRAGARGVLTSNALASTSYGNLLLAKMSLFLVIIVIGVVITRTGLKLFKLAPPASQGVPLGPPPAFVIKAQQRIKMLSEINIGLGVVAVLLAVALT